VLIYLTTMHRYALGLFHFALEPGGYLLLGRSETASSSPDLFQAVDQQGRLFKARGAVAGRQFPRSPGVGHASRRPPPPVPQDAVVSESAYEELVAANEELQSLNEELDSSKEEIESVNEELRTLNQELSSRNDALRVANEYAQATFDTVRSALVVLDQDLRVVSANRSFYKTFGLSPADVERHELSEAAPGCFGAPAVRDLLEEIRAGAVSRDDVELDLEVPGSPRRVLVANARRFTPAKLVLLAFDDVTRARALEVERAQSQKMAAVGRLAAGVAHDFNNLLTIMLAGVYLAAQDIPEGSRAREELDRVTTAANRAADLTRQLLAYAGKARSIAERVDLSTIVTQTATLLHASIPAHVRLRLDLDRDLPLLLADPSQIHQVVANLMTNAIEAVGEAGAAVLVRTGRLIVVHGDVAEPAPDVRLPPGDYVFVEVEDSGVGMTPDVQRQMFDPFFTTKFMGRGLGLAATQGIVSQHQGAIAVRSAVGRGTSITAFFATQPVPLVAPPGEQASALPRRAAALLVVDDEPLVLDLTKKALESFGHTVLTAERGAQAVEIAQAHPEIALVVLDAIMPEMDGPETLRRLRALRPELPVLVCSAVGDTALEQMFAGHGVAGYVHKPFAAPRLGEQVASALSGGK
jgi:nitrogen-specific signal transduction histidine kinase/CheY-like chemotaxis protein